MKYPNSGLKTKDFYVGEEVITIDPSGNITHFREGDICTVTQVGGNCIYVNIHRTGVKSKLYAYRFAKLNHFKIKDEVRYDNNEGTIVSFEGKNCLVSCGRDLVSKHEDELTLIGRKKLI